MDIEKHIANIQQDIENLRRPHPRKKRFWLLFLLPLVLLPVGGLAAVDYARVSKARQALSAGVDASALFAASLTNKTEAEMQVLAKNYVDQNFTTSTGSPVEGFELHDLADRVTIAATTKVPCTFMGMVGLGDIEVAATSEVLKASGSVAQ
jgi:Flp pilus assembly protein TadG